MVTHRDTSKINLVSKTKFQYPVDIGIPQISDPEYAFSILKVDISQATDHWPHTLLKISRTQ